MCIRDRMKAGREHVVPLSKRAMETLTPLSEMQQGEFVFAHPHNQKPFSVNAPRALLKRMGRDETLHGFRATFKSWATDKSHFQREIIEMALAHKVGNDVEASYLRTSAIEKRRALMNQWSAYCLQSKSQKVVKLHG